MRKILTLILATLLSGSMIAQSSQVISKEQIRAGERSMVQRSLIDVPGAESTNVTAPSPQHPVGTVLTDAVTAIKIAEASNAFTFLLPESHPIATSPTAGGGSVAFIHRQNIGQCGGATIDNGLYRYSISTDGGSSWDVGAPNLSTSTNTPGGCYGKGTINPSYVQVTRYPNASLMLPSGSTSASDLNMIYSGPVLNPGYPSVNGWDGHVSGVVSMLDQTTPTISQETYFNQSGNQFFAYSMVERIPGEYWFVAWSYDPVADAVGNDLILNKGVVDPVSKQITWTVAKFLPMSFQTFTSDATGDVIDAQTAPSIAFSPSGDTGYVALLGDIGARDSVYSPITISSFDGGLTWGDPVEFDTASILRIS